MELAEDICVYILGFLGLEERQGQHVHDGFIHTDGDSAVVTGISMS